jgi:hypothetical protein
MDTFFFTAYEILVVTGDKTGAGTNANAFVKHENKFFLPSFYDL